MNLQNRFDPFCLKEEAKRSADHEAFQVLATIQNFRIGVGTTIDSTGNYEFFIEVLIKLCKELHPVDLPLIEKRLLVLRQLSERGFTLNCEEHGWISSEFAVCQDSIINEVDAVGKIIDSCIAEAEVIAP